MNKEKPTMTVTKTLTFTDAQYEALSDYYIQDECLRVALDGDVCVYTVDNNEVILWVIEPDGSTHQERLIYDGWVRFEYNESTGDWEEADDE
jgi:hypothetical protein